MEIIGEPEGVHGRCQSVPEGVQQGCLTYPTGTYLSEHLSPHVQNAGPKILRVVRKSAQDSREEKKKYVPSTAVFSF